MKQLSLDAILGNILDKTGISCFNLISEINLKIKPIQYIFISEEEYSTAKDLNDVTYIYWLEIIERCHILALTSLLRNLKWIEALCQAYANNNYYSFSSCLRSLIESLKLPRKSGHEVKRI
jgi:hypothetical protein